MKKLPILAAMTLVLLGSCVVVRSRAYGKPMPEGKTLAVTSAVHHSDVFGGKRVKVEGVVAEVCPTRGCWMVIASGDDKLRVTFDDAEVLMPKDCVGSPVQVEGQLAADGRSLIASSVVLSDV